MTVCWVKNLDLTVVRRLRDSWELLRGCRPHSKAYKLKNTVQKRGQLTYYSYIFTNKKTVSLLQQNPDCKLEMLTELEISHILAFFGS